MDPSNSAAAKDIRALGQTVAAEGVLQSKSGVAAKHCYVGVRCKSCLQEGKTTWLLLKYLGANGNAPYKLDLPPAPRMARFQMYCETCDVNDFYARNEAQLVNLEKAPPADFVNQY